ncbi:hypothetical protein [Bacillus cereus]
MFQLEEMINLDEIRNGNSNPLEFCCSIDIPENFKPDLNSINFIYNLNCLQTITELCKICVDTTCGPVYADIYKTKVIGCIPYIISIKISGQCGGKLDYDSTNCTATIKDPDNKEAYLCCKGNICVDQIIQCTTEYPQPITLNCKNVELTQFQAGNAAVNICDNPIACTPYIFTGILEIKIPPQKIQPCKNPSNIPEIEIDLNQPCQTPTN